MGCFIGLFQLALCTITWTDITHFKSEPIMVHPTQNQPEGASGFAVGGKSASELQSMGKNFLARLTLPGKLLLAGSLIGFVACFLPFFSVSVSGNTGPINLKMSQSAMALEAWQGIIALLTFGGCAVLSYLLFGEKPHANQRELMFATLGCAAVALVMTLWLFFQTSGGTNVSMEIPIPKVSAGRSIGAYLMLVGAGLAVVGSIMKAKEDRLF